MNTKAKGTRLEHKTMDYLEAIGYLTTRSAASLGAFDVIAVGPIGVRLIQVKANRAPGPPEREQMEAISVPDNCTIEYWVWKDYARKPIVSILQRGKWVNE